MRLDTLKQILQDESTELGVDPATPSTARIDFEITVPAFSSDELIVR